MIHIISVAFQKKPRRRHNKDAGGNGIGTTLGIETPV